jgi:hypothetical protein
MATVFEYAAAFGWIVVIGAAYLLREYIVKRVSEAARGAIDRGLAEHQHHLDVSRERLSRDYQIYAEQRFRVYTETYAAYEKAHGAFAKHFRIFTESRDFRRSPRADLLHIAERLDAISEAERQELRRLADHDFGKAGPYATALWKKNELRMANRYFTDFRNTVVLNQLYFSSDVDSLLNEMHLKMASLSVLVDELIEGEQWDRVDRDKSYKALEALEEVGSRVRRAMRDELQAAVPAKSPPPVKGG